MNNKLKLHVVTVATHSKYYLPYLIESCKKYGGIKLDIVGLGEKWKGYNWKLVKILEYLRTLPPDDIVCFVDGYDVICTRNLHELLPIFTKIKRKNNCKIIVAHDIHPFYIDPGAYTVFGTCKSQFINSGTYIGVVSDLLEIIQNIYNVNPDNNVNDQIVMTQYCDKNVNDFYIDTKNEIFLTIIYNIFKSSDMSTYVDFQGENIVYKGNRPFFYHANGNGILYNVIRKLGMKLDHNRIKEEMQKTLMNKTLYYAKVIFYKKESKIIFFIMSLIILFYFYKTYKIHKVRK
jgi:hypothetical protein